MSFIFGCGPAEVQPEIAIPERSEALPKLIRRRIMTAQELPLVNSIRLVRIHQQSESGENPKITLDLTVRKRKSIAEIFNALESLPRGGDRLIPSAMILRPYFLLVNIGATKKLHYLGQDPTPTIEIISRKAVVSGRNDEELKWILANRKY
ncbi:MAG: hypothetical protein K8R88_02890 [Armatimonadetes bacterium]|nr:hypothetical protein [Armatimonadota bacterium]